MYAIGDKIAHPLHGAATVDAIVTQKVGGVPIVYYAISLPGSGMNVMVPVETADRIGIRPVVSPEEAERVLSLFDEKEKHVTANWNTRYRENLARIKTGRLEEVAKVIKVLTKCDYDKGLSGGERKMLYNARLILVSEIALVKGVPYEEIDAQITKVMQKHYLNI